MITCNIQSLFKVYSKARPIGHWHKLSCIVAITETFNTEYDLTVQYTNYLLQSQSLFKKHDPCIGTNDN